jgi:hypothetical protein
MKLDTDLLQLAGHPLYGFGGKQVNIVGKIILPVTFGDQHNSRTEHITFDVVDMLYNYNAIFGRGVTNAFSMVLHPGYLYKKLPSAKGIIAVYGNQDLARIVEETATLGQKNEHTLEKKKEKEKEPPLDEPEQQLKSKPAEETKTVTLFEGNKNEKVIISTLLDHETEAKLVQFLCDNSNIFAWSAEDLRGVDRSVMEHILDVKEGY